MMQAGKGSVAPIAGGRNDAPARQEISCLGNTFVLCVRLVDGRVDEAWSTGRMMRNMNVLLRGGLDEQGRPQFVQQAHCLCNDGHALAAVRALEDLAGVVPPRNARLVRSLVQALRCIQEHLLHVYQFHLSDWVCLESALRADPAKAARLVRHSDQETEYFRTAQNRLRNFAREQGNPLGNGNGAHPEYRGEDELHLMLQAHALESLRTGVTINTALGLLGCGSDGFKAHHLGGLPEDMDLGGDVRRQLRGLLMDCRDFIDRTFLADLELLAQAYSHWADTGVGHVFLSWGDCVRPWGNGRLFPGGLVAPAGELGNGGGEWKVRPAHGPIREEREPRWSPEDQHCYRLRLDDKGLDFHWGPGEFAWLPAPRHGQGSDGEACEVGSLARILGSWAQGQGRVCRAMRNTLDACGLNPSAMNSTLGRVLSRGLESLVLSQAALEWLDELDSALAHGDTLMRVEVSLPPSGLGTGRVEVPRGALMHTIRLEDKRIASHDYLIPSLWNFSPRDSNGVRGPLEQALLGTAVADPGHPLEILRTVHAFDPCNACHLVVEDLDAGRTTLATAK